MFFLAILSITENGHLKFPFSWPEMLQICYFLNFHQMKIKNMNPKKILEKISEKDEDDIILTFWQFSLK